MLIAGCVEQIRSEVRAPILVTLQGDDLFLEQLDEPYKSQAIGEIRRLVRHIDGFIVFSRYYADFMADYFGIPPEKLAITPLGVDTGGTYTDAVLIRDEQEVVASAKSLTTRAGGDVVGDFP